MFKKEDEGVYRPLKDEITLKNILEYKSPNLEQQSQTTHNQNFNAESRFMPASNLSISRSINAATVNLQNAVNQEANNMPEAMNEGANGDTGEGNNSSSNQQQQAPLSKSPPMNTFGLPTSLNSVLNALDSNNMQS